MECEKVRQEFPDIKFEPCCESCHEDEDMGFGEDLWYLDKWNKLRNICCAMARGFDNE